MSPGLAHFTVLLAMSFLAVACTGDGSSSEAADSGAPMDEGDTNLECTLGGTYGVFLTARGGNCGPQSDPAEITVPETMTLASQTETLGDRQVTSAFVFKGCGLRLSREVTSNTGLRISSLHAGALELVAEGLIEGQASVQRYTDTTPQQVACEGSYDMTMRLQP